MSRQRDISPTESDGQASKEGRKEGRVIVIERRRINVGN